MKFLNGSLFKSFLAKNTLHQYLVVVEDEYERKKIISFILKQPFMQKFSVVKMAEASFAKIMSEMQSFSLFGDPFIVLQDIKELKKEEINDFFSLLQQGNFFGVIGASSKQDVLKIYNLFEKEKVVFDLTQEKPWEKKSRFEDFIKEKCFENKIAIDQEVVLEIVERVDDDLSRLEQEIEKLITFALDKKRIDLDDVLQMMVLSHENTIWQMAEEMVWQNKREQIVNIDSSFFHGLIASIRYQLSIGYKMASLVENNVTQDGFLSYFPKMYPKSVLKKKEIAAKNGSGFYKLALKNLFEIDFLSKNNITNYELLLDLFKSKSML